MVSKMKALVVSKEVDLPNLMKENLSDDNYEVVIISETGAELRQVLEEESPDLVILDIMMPSLDGIEVCLRIRQWSLVPIIMLSTWGVDGGKVRGLNLSDETYLTQPFGIDELKTRINEALKKNIEAMLRMRNIYPRVPLEK